ncbi:hypothetical protein Rhe02_08500 [Rhizocola hellebori]|uniref:Phage tail collar domain-containing protein n=1 Tax=Rhizocola hellebori TaxID=1392758 RepID=A0A8J3Q3Q1_9ACTN|nr:phage tail protein [Rhizocola hellebori]GIH02783.1 hypothetical protein Rhe02_08500 [Rhizocola hellebori]
MTEARQGRPAGVMGNDDVSIGMIVGFGGVITDGTQVPDGWLLCDGSAISRTTYSYLFGVIGVAHGGGDGSQTFNLPDYRGQFQRGVDDGTGRDPDTASRTAANPGGATGDAVGSVQGKATALPQYRITTDSQGSHQHMVANVPVDYSRPDTPGSHYAQWNGSAQRTGSAGGHGHTISGGDADTCPVNIYLNYLIFYGSTS